MWLTLFNAEGATGASGLHGATGQPGETGSPGIDGSTGSTGPRGERGSTGRRGISGATGNTGYRRAFCLLILHVFLPSSVCLNYTVSTDKRLTVNSSHGELVIKTVIRYSELATR